MPYLNVEGCKQFKHDTGKEYGFALVKVRVSGHNLKPIVDALDHYGRVRNSGGEEVMRALCSIVSQCRKWLRVKSAKIAEAASGQPTVVKRKNVVTALQDEAIYELRKTMAGQGVVDAIGAYETRKDAGRRAGVISLAPGYANERAAYLKFDKKTSISGTSVRELLEAKTTRGGMGLPAKADSKFDTNYRKKIGDDADGFFKALTIKDWEAIEKIAREVEGHQIEVRYFNKFERIKCLLESDGHGGLRYCNGLDAKTTHKLGDPWGMDEWGNLYTSPEEKGLYGMFNHSSFTAGDIVVCAGNIVIDSRGKAVKIDNRSGHYAPDPERLRAAVEIMQNEYHIDFSQTEIWATAMVGGVLKVWPYCPVADGRTVLVAKTVTDFLNRSPDSQNKPFFAP